jgi:polyisoprenoid-binding protein YceI
MTVTMTKSGCFALLLLAFGSVAYAAEIDLAASKITVKVEKTGLFSAFAHDHTIAALLASGHLDVQKRTVELKFRSQDMKVLDPGIKDSERDDIDRTMKSYKVLDAGRFPEIVFVSTSVETPAVGAKASGTSAAGADAAKRYLVHGKLTLHGVTRPVELPVSFSEGHYTGKVTLKQTEFGITPVKIAGGTVKVKDAIEIVFEIVPTR